MTTPDARGFVLVTVRRPRQECNTSRISRYAGGVTVSSGESRPGGRTARTRAAVHEATRALMADGRSFGIADVAQRSGVHVATLYRRWGRLENLVLDVAATDLAGSQPLPATGDLVADLRAWISSLLEDTRRPEGPAFFGAMVDAAQHGGLSADGFEELLRPRWEQMQALLVAAGVVELTVVDLVVLVLAPVYLTAMFPAVDGAERYVSVESLVDNVIAVLERRRAGLNG